jgi:hypothetical protein
MQALRCREYFGLWLRRWAERTVGSLVGMSLVILVGGVLYGIVLRAAQLLPAVHKEKICR